MKGSIDLKIFRLRIKIVLSEVSKSFLKFVSHRFEEQVLPTLV